MRGSGRFPAAMAAGICLCACSLCACGSKEEAAFSPAESCIYVEKDGALSSALVVPLQGQKVEEADLREYLEAAVARFNEAQGAQALSENPEEGERLPAALQSLSLDGEKATVIFEYASLEDLNAFRQTEDNDDQSSSVTALEVADAASAAGEGWLDGTALKDADGQAVSAEEAGVSEHTAALIEGGGTVMFSGQIIGASEEAEFVDTQTVRVPEDGRTVVIFK